MENQFAPEYLSVLARKNGFNETSSVNILYQQLMSWLSIEYDINTSITRVGVGSQEMEFSYAIHYLPKEHRGSTKRWVSHMIEIEAYEEYINGTYSGAWRTWYKAAEEALVKAFNLI